MTKRDNVARLADIRRILFTANEHDPAEIRRKVRVYLEGGGGRRANPDCDTAAGIVRDTFDFMLQSRVWHAKTMEVLLDHDDSDPGRGSAGGDPESGSSGSGTGPSAIQLRLA